MTAKEMYEALGFTQTSNTKTLIRYEKEVVTKAGLTVQFIQSFENMRGEKNVIDAHTPKLYEAHRKQIEELKEME
jgi:hypothetical protein